MGIIYSRSEQKVQEVYRDFVNHNLIVDERYQRRSVWIERDKIRLIETILLGLIVPELYFWDAETDADSGQTITHIVDGQQRVKAIVDFIENKFKLQKDHLIEPGAKELYGDKLFSELDDEAKKQLWAFRLSVIRIENKNMDEIRKIFYRVNLTNYSLNDQEKRHSNSWGRFADLTSEILALSIWDDYNLFNSGDIRRRKDEEFCSTLIILARRGIIDQTTQTPLNDAYTDYAKDYPDYESDKNRITNWCNTFPKFCSNITYPFIRKRTQLYTVFCLIDYLERKNIQITDEIITRFNSFAEQYLKFDNASDSSNTNGEEYNVIQQYKLAASEGVNKLKNRKIRFEILRDFILN